MANEYVLQTEGLTKEFKGFTAVKNVDLKVRSAGVYQSRFALGDILVEPIVLGWHWMLLPGLVMEAIPGVDILPFWLLVVGSIAVLGTVRPKLKQH